MTLDDWLKTAPLKPYQNYWREVKQWVMGGNDTHNDCSFVTLGNLEELVTSVNGNPQTMMDAEILHFDAVENGFVEGKIDRGEFLPKLLDYWQKNGWPGDPMLKPLGWCTVKPYQLDMAVHIFGAVPSWCMLPEKDDDSGDYDFRNDAVYSHAEGKHAHSVTIVGAGPDGIDLVSWAGIYHVSTLWWNNYGRESFAVWHPEWKLPAGVELYEFKE